MSLSSLALRLVVATSITSSMQSKEDCQEMKQTLHQIDKALDKRIVELTPVNERFDPAVLKDALVCVRLNHSNAKESQRSHLKRHLAGRDFEGHDGLVERVGFFTLGPCVLKMVVRFDGEESFTPNRNQYDETESSDEDGMVNGGWHPCGGGTKMSLSWWQSADHAADDLINESASEAAWRFQFDSIQCNQSEWAMVNETNMLSARKLIEASGIQRWDDKVEHRAIIDAKFSLCGISINYSDLIKCWKQISFNPYRPTNTWPYSVEAQGSDLDLDGSLEDFMTLYHDQEGEALGLHYDERDPLDDRAVRSFVANLIVMLTDKLREETPWDKGGAEIFNLTRRYWRENMTGEMVCPNVDYIAAHVKTGINPQVFFDYWP